MGTRADRTRGAATGVAVPSDGVVAEKGNQRGGIYLMNHKWVPGNCLGLFSHDGIRIRAVEGRNSSTAACELSLHHCTGAMAVLHVWIGIGSFGHCN